MAFGLQISHFIQMLYKRHNHSFPKNPYLKHIIWSSMKFNIQPPPNKPYKYHTQSAFKLTPTDNALIDLEIQLLIKDEKPTPTDNGTRD